MKRINKNYSMMSGFLAVLIWNAASIVLAEGLRDVKSPILYPANYLWIYLLLAVLLLVAAFLFWNLMKKRAQQAIEALEKISPKEMAYAQLRALIQADLLSKGQIHDFYLRLSDIVRQYFEDQFQIKAPEMTSEEFLEYMKNSDLLTEKQKDSLRDFLFSCDMVKFAQYTSSVEEGTKSISFVKELIDQARTSTPTEG